MNAKRFVELATSCNADLVGTRLKTPALGDYPGGIATVIGVAPDPCAPEIVLQVHLPDWGDIGVFENEEVELI